MVRKKLARSSGTHVQGARQSRLDFGVGRKGRLDRKEKRGGFRSKTTESEEALWRLSVGGICQKGMTSG